MLLSLQRNQVWKDCVAVHMFSPHVVGAETEITLDASTAVVEPFHVEDFFTNDRISELICFTTVPMQQYN